MRKKLLASLTFLAASLVGCAANHPDSASTVLASLVPERQSVKAEEPIKNPPNRVQLSFSDSQIYPQLALDSSVVKQKLGRDWTQCLPNADWQQFEDSRIEGRVKLALHSQHFLNSSNSQILAIAAQYRWNCSENICSDGPTDQKQFVHMILYSIPPNDLSKLVSDLGLTCG